MSKLNEIKVGGFKYKIIYKDDAFVGIDGSSLDGSHCFAEQAITIAKRGHNEYQNIVLLHEICHAIIEVYVSPEKQDEHFVEQFSKGLYQVLKDNPELKELV